MEDVSVPMHLRVNQPKSRGIICVVGFRRGVLVCNHNLHAVLGALPHQLGENPYQHGVTVNVCNFQHENGQKSTCSKHRASVKYHLLEASLGRHCFFLKGTFEKPFWISQDGMCFHSGVDPRDETHFFQSIPGMIATRAEVHQTGRRSGRIYRSIGSGMTVLGSECEQQLLLCDALEQKSALALGKRSECKARFFFLLKNQMYFRARVGNLWNKG